MALRLLALAAAAAASPASPASRLLDALVALFSPRVVSVRLFRGDAMALVTMDCAASAVAALMHTHLSTLHGRRLRVSFSAERDAKARAMRSGLSLDARSGQSLDARQLQACGDGSGDGSGGGGGYRRDDFVRRSVTQAGAGVHRAMFK